MFQRTLAPLIEDVSNQFPVLLLTGPRQAGKTTLLSMCAEPGRNYVTLDDLDVRALARDDPGLFVQTYAPPLIIDEIQYAPGLFSYIKIRVDRSGQQPGMYWLTGSQKFSLMRGITESLAGRVAIIDLLGLSQAESDNRAGQSSPFVPTNDWILSAGTRTDAPSDIHGIYERIWQGSFPKVAGASPRQRDLYYRSYIQTYIQRDVRGARQIANETAFYNFLVAVAARTGQMLNYADLARDMAIDNKTAKSWLSVLEASGLIYLLKPYYRNITKRLIKAPKLFFLDTGLASYLTKWTDPASLEAGAMSGAMLETYCFADVLKSYWHHGQEAHFYYYRDRDQREIDLVIETADRFHPVEFKKTGTPSKTAIKYFPLLERLGKPAGQGTVICFVEKPILLSSEVTAIPVSYL
uniref:AAA+ ATPase domain-containing protein n=1 Tax=Candidatus Kentrum sp. FW TaxID=2126338 RepID=A0A450SIG0_9GAMM|nr:MAG: hypothetical protein BECKFW1821B_GA0114236_10149 [Candidatus Kentron sp. FW]VFJ55656.1 MAG: hypothetical protein BECKFW1821A_GA0114235_10554 [Candidatus Kentron sp. FW]